MKRKYTNRKFKDYAIYKGDTFLCVGTAIECAKYLRDSSKNSTLFGNYSI